MAWRTCSAPNVTECRRSHYELAVVRSGNATISDLMNLIIPTIKAIFVSFVLGAGFVRTNSDRECEFGVSSSGIRIQCSCIITFNNVQSILNKIVLFATEMAFRWVLLHALSSVCYLCCKNISMLCARVLL